MPVSVRRAVPGCPGEEIADGSGVCLAGVAVADSGGQKLDEAFACLLPGAGDDRGEDGAARGCRDDAGRCLGQLARHGRPPARVMAAARAGGRIAAVPPSQRPQSLAGKKREHHGLTL